MPVLLLLLTIAEASSIVSVATINYSAATAAVVIYDGTSAWSINMDGPTKSIIPLYDLTSAPSTPLTYTIVEIPPTATSTASAIPSMTPSASSSSLNSPPTLVSSKSTPTSIAGPINTPNGSSSATDLITFTDQSTSAVMSGAVIGGCLLGGFAIAFLWLLWKCTIRTGEGNHSTFRERLSSARRVTKAWPSLMHQPKVDPIRPTSWDEVRDSFSDLENPFRDSLAPSTVSWSRFSDETASEGGYQETAEVRSERLDRMFRRSHSPVPSERHEINGHSFDAIRDSYSMELLSSPRSATMVPLPPILKRASIPAPLLTGQGLSSPIRSAQRNPSKYDSSLTRPLRSPLKSPLKSPLTYSGAMPSRHTAENVVSVTTSATKKEVRFGGEQIKEFGRTPYASTVNSAAEEFDNQDLTV
ncbi:hypothetical protein MMC11_000817 [Xylographa trunciseda]|nr:hypothetical protein [Xylographa trunciseda]